MKSYAIIGCHSTVHFVMDGGVVSSESDTKCAHNNMAFMNIYTMEVEAEVTWEDVKCACNKGKIWTFTEKGAAYVLFYIRCEVFKIYSKEWGAWVHEDLGNQG